MTITLIVPAKGGLLRHCVPRKDGKTETELVEIEVLNKGMDIPTSLMSGGVSS